MSYNRHYMLYVWIPKFKTYFPYKIYASKHYALDKATNLGALKFKIERINKYDSFKHDLEIYYKANTNENGDQDPKLGYYEEMRIKLWLKTTLK